MAKGPYLVQYSSAYSAHVKLLGPYKSNQDARNAAIADIVSVLLSDADKTEIEQELIQYNSFDLGNNEMIWEIVKVKPTKN